MVCPSKKGKHFGARCTATIPKGEIFDEGDMAKQIGSHLKQEYAVDISHVTSDSDGKGIQGIRDVMGPDVKWQKDLVHISKKQIRALNNAEFSTDIFRDMRASQKVKAKLC